MRWGRSLGKGIENWVMEEYICLSFTEPWFWKYWADISQTKFKNFQNNYLGQLEKSVSSKKCKQILKKKSKTNQETFIEAQKLSMEVIFILC